MEHSLKKFWTKANQNPIYPGTAFSMSKSSDGSELSFAKLKHTSLS